MITPDGRLGCHALVFYFNFYSNLILFLILFQNLRPAEILSCHVWGNEETSSSLLSRL